MSTTSTTDTSPSRAQSPAPASGTRWRTVDIVVGAVIAAAFGIVFYAWDQAWNGMQGMFTSVPWAAGLVYGVWYIPCVLGPMIIRKPGSGVFTSTVAAAISALLGAKWGLLTILAGVLQGIGGEAPFAAIGYRNPKLPTALAGGALAGCASVLDLVIWYQSYSAAAKLGYVAGAALSGLVVAGAGSYFLTRALAGTGALDRFPSGRDRALV
jgi:energy-coupling factor transport system permease protein